MDVTAAGELLGRGEAEATGHLVVAGVVGEVGVDRHGAGGEGHRGGARPVGGGRGLATAGQDLVRDVLEVGPRVGAGLDLLGLQLGGQVTVEVRSGAQRRGRDRARNAGIAVDEEELLLDTHGTGRHTESIACYAGIRG